MAMPKKGSRVILVAHQSFRWRVRATFADGFSPVTVWLTVERAEDPGCQLRVPFYGEFGYGLLHRKDEYWRELVIEPKLVADCIEVALRDGWDPADRQRHFTVRNAASLLPRAPVRFPYPLPEPEEGWSASIERLERDVAPRTGEPVGEPWAGQRRSNNAART
jgi:hypothetical protein